MSNSRTTASRPHDDKRGIYAITTHPKLGPREGIPLVYSAVGGIAVGVFVGFAFLFAGGDEAGAKSKTPSAQGSHVGGPEAAGDVAPERSAKVVEDGPREASLRFEVTPEKVEDLSIHVDGEEVDPKAMTLSLQWNGSEERTVLVVATAKGFEDVRKQFSIRGDESLPIAFSPIAEVPEAEDQAAEPGETDETDKVEDADKVEESQSSARKERDRKKRESKKRDKKRDSKKRDDKKRDAKKRDSKKRKSTSGPGGLLDL